jgi:putative transposase
MTTGNGACLTELVRENRELRQANEILRAAVTFFRRAFDPHRTHVVTFIDEYRVRFGVEPICRQVAMAPSTYYAKKARPPSARKVRDEYLKATITKIYAEKPCGVRTIWQELRRRGERVGRDQVARLMRELGISGRSSRC